MIRTKYDVTLAMAQRVAIRLSKIDGPLTYRELMAAIAPEKFHNPDAAIQKLVFIWRDDKPVGRIAIERVAMMLAAELFSLRETLDRFIRARAGLEYALRDIVNGGELITREDLEAK